MTIHELCLQALNSQCPCGAPPGCPCVCESSHYHYARFSLATTAGHIPRGEFASIIHDFEVVQGFDTVCDPGILA